MIMNCLPTYLLGSPAPRKNLNRQLRSRQHCALANSDSGFGLWPGFGPESGFGFDADSYSGLGSASVSASAPESVPEFGFGSASGH